MLNMQDINENIYRLQICQWAYGWSHEQLICEIKKMISEKQWQNYFKQKEDEEKMLQNLIFEIKNQKVFDINLLKEEKNKTYGNKYLKRKYRCS